MRRALRADPATGSRPFSDPPGVKSHAKPLPEPLAAAPFSIAEAAEAGVHRSRLRAGDLVAPFVGVRVAETDGETDAETDTEAGQEKLKPLDLARAYQAIMSPAEFFSHVTAALIHGIWLPLHLERQALLDVSVHKPARAPRDRRVRGHHLIPRVGLVQEKDGFRVASPIETWCQLATCLTLAQLIVAGDALVQHGRARPDQVRAAMLAAADDAARPMSRRLQEAVRAVRLGSRSPQESALRVLLMQAGLPEPEVNGRILDGRGRFVAECDLVYRTARVVIEYEGDLHRTDKKVFRNDIRRYELLKDLGWRVIRVTSDDLVERPDETVRRVRQALSA